MESPSTITDPLTSWSLPVGAGRSEELDDEECWRLISSGTVGRLGYVGESLPRIIPVNYRVLDRSIIFRTVPDGEIAQFALGRTVAFEVDAIDEFLHSGWSVLMSGILRELDPSTIQALDHRDTPQPWPAGSQTMFCRLEPTQISGRCIHPS